jgi:hypothetical protein
MTLQLQSFVIGAVVAAIFFAERLGAPGTLPRRLYQVSLGFALVFVVTSATAAFFRSDPSNLFNSLLSGSSSSAVQLSTAGGGANKAAEALSVQAGFAMIFLLSGFMSYSRLTTLPLGFAFGGLLLLLASGGQASGDPTSYLSSLSSVFGGAFGHASKSRDVIHFVVLLIGTAALIGYGYKEWESQSTGRDAANPGVG